MSKKDVIVYGIRPVFEILNSNLTLKKVWVEQGKVEERKQELQDLCLKKNVELLEKSGRFLHNLCGQENHQGLVASYIPKQSELCFESSSTPRTGSSWLCVYLDRIQDPHNFGAIVRSSEFFGADQIFYPEHHAAPWNEVAMKASAGAGAHNPPFKVSAVTTFFEQLQARGFQIVGALPDAPMKAEAFDFTKDTVLLIGHEGEGLSEKLRKTCTAFVQIPQVGQIESLNASVSAGILLYEIQRQRSLNSVDNKNTIR